MTAARGRFITIEGLEGVGKSTNVEFIRSELEKRNKNVIVTREPGGTALAERIRDTVLNSHDEYVPEICELLLVFASRSAHLTNLIRPALDVGTWVVCDRFTDATFAYQGGGRGVPADVIRNLEALVQEGLKPDLTLLLDAPVGTARKRARARNELQKGDIDRIEREQAPFFERARAAYLELAQAEPGRVRVVEADRSREEVQEAIAAELRAFMKAHD